MKSYQVTENLHVTLTYYPSEQVSAPKPIEKFFFLLIGLGIISIILIVILGFLTALWYIFPLAVIIILYQFFASFFDRYDYPKPADGWEEVIFTNGISLKKKDITFKDIPKSIQTWITENYDLDPEKYLFKRLKAEPSTDFWSGYSLEDPVLIEYEGIFYLRIIQDKETSSVRYPLFFYDFSTGKSTEMDDLSGFLFYDSQGGPSDFVIRGENEKSHQEVEIHFTSNPH